MKKIINLLITLTFLSAATLLLTGCDSQGVNPDLVGTWVYQRDLGVTMRLDDDGTGRRGGLPGETFDWTASSSELRINRRNAPAREIENERWNFTLDGDVLRIESRQQAGTVRYHLRDGVVGEVDSAFIGSWAWDGNIFWEYVFNADGTGTRGLPDDMDGFTWGILDDMLRIRLNSVPLGAARNEHWNFTLSGDSLDLVNRHASSQAFSYTLDGSIGAPDPALVGQWNWNEDYTWSYIFNDDGTGTRGQPVRHNQPVNIIRIYWGVTSTGELRILPQEPAQIGQVRRSITDIGSVESWSFDIDGDTLRLQYVQDSNVAFDYTRD